ncbi:protein ENDO16-like [Eriocheir sinensis]|uniref:protein ENDO16-like n=1 Tax=Eriocheir sinensis TaxID=95602 RepID=UPI0021C842AF|nr:protein ENDO16-like [Eriocheir sinensis]
MESGGGVEEGLEVGHGVGAWRVRGMESEGMESEGMESEGMESDGGEGGVESEGMESEGMESEGMESEGMESEGMESDGGEGRPRWDIHGFTGLSLEGYPSASRKGQGMMGRVEPPAQTVWRRGSRVPAGPHRYLEQQQSSADGHPEPLVQEGRSQPTPGIIQATQWRDSQSISA